MGMGWSILGDGGSEGGDRDEAGSPVHLAHAFLD